MRYLLLVTLALASQTAAAADHYSFRIKTVSKSNAVAFVPVGEVTRGTDGTVTAKGIAAPSLDKRADGLVADWAHYKIPASVDIVRYLPNGSYMHNSTTKRTVTFTPKDAMFTAAVLDRFLEARGLDAGMLTIDFIIHDSEGGSPTPTTATYDGGSSYTNFRKNPELEFNNGHRDFYIYAPVRPPLAELPGPVSPTDKKLALSKRYDSGGVLIAWIDLTPDGTVTIHPEHTAEQFDKQFASTFATDPISVAVVDGGEYKSVAVAKTEKRFFEAAVAAVADSNGYDVTPVLDAGVFR